MTESNYQHHLPIGSELAEYRIESILGEGGFGVTYLATDLNLGRKFAIKEYLPGDFAVRTDNSTVVPKSKSEGDNFQWGLDRFLDEARTLATFKHPNLNQVNRFFKANGTAYMVLEYIEGETLSDRLKRDPTLSEPELRNLLERLLGGLEVVHNAGYTHRDIKPGNIMIQPDGTPVLLDFGAARQALGCKSKSMTAILTPGYAPIEQYATKAEDIGPWTDIYSLGMVAYQCIRGCKTSELIEAGQRVLYHGKGQAEKDLTPATVVGQGKYPAEFLKAIDWAIQAYDNLRPQSVDEWQRGLFQDAAIVESKPTAPDLVSEPETVLEPPKPATPAPQANPPGSGLKYALIGVILTVLVGGGFFALSGDKSQPPASPTASSSGQSAQKGSTVDTTKGGTNDPKAYSPPTPPIHEDFEGEPKLSFFPRVGDFRPAAEDERSPYWKTFIGQLLKVSGMVESPEDGNKAWSFRSVNTIDSLGYFSPIAVEPGTTYSVSFKLKAELPEGATAGLGILDFNEFLWVGEQYTEKIFNEHYRGVHKGVELSGTIDWRVHNFRITTGADTEMIHLVLFRNGTHDSSRVLFDDIRIESVRGDEH